MAPREPREIESAAGPGSGTKEEDMIALDTETELIGYDNPREPGVQIPRLVCVSWQAGIAPAEVLPWNYDWLAPCVAAFFSEHIVGHNIAYDMLVLARQFPDLLPLIFAAYDADRVTDTGLRAKLLDIADGRRTYTEDDAAPKGYRKSAYGLADLSQRYLGRTLSKDGIRLSYAALRDVPFDQWPAAAIDYSRDDARATYDVWAEQEKRASELGDQYRQARAELALKLASAWGLVPDPVAVAALAERVDREIDLHSTALRAAGLLRSNGTQAMDVVHARVEAAFPPDVVEAADLDMGIAIVSIDRVPRTPTGRPKTDRETCEKTDDPVLHAYAAFKRLAAVRQKDLPMLRKTPVIHTRFETLVETGRTASSSPNVQNLAVHGGVRECFSARAGCAYVVADYAGLELSTWAQVCFTLFGRSALRDRIIAGIDSHLTLAAELSGRDYADLLAHKKDPDVYDLRQTGKAGNFGAMGGMGAATFAKQAKAKYNVSLSEDEARKVLAAWRTINPEAAQYFRYIDQHETVIQQGSGRVRSGASYTERCNSPFQGLGADLAKDALYRVARAQMVGPMVGRTVNFVHDEIVVETPLECVDETAREVEACMLVSARKWLPDVPCGVEIHATRVYSKSAKRVVDAEGRLLVWEPIAVTTRIVWRP